MTEPLSIFTAPPRSEQTATIPADLLAWKFVRWYL
jgi:hypothetical protein